MSSTYPTIVAADDPASLTRAVARLKAGELVAFPTETVYGLGADARNPAAVRRIFALKGRPSSHPLIVHLGSGAQLEEWSAQPSREAFMLAEAFWPGPLTLVLRRSSSVPDAVTGGQETVALRVPAHPVASALLTGFGSGVAAPSANRFGHVSPTTAAHVATEFPATGLLILDGGQCQVGLESTIVDLSQADANSAPRLLRPGGVTLAAIEEVLGRSLQLPAGAQENERASSGRAAAEITSGSGLRQAPRVPGTHASHYAPTAPCRLAASSELESVANLTVGSAVLARRPEPVGFTGRWIQLPNEPIGYARELYAALRDLDAAAPQQILVEAAPGGDAWLAVRDRLARATASASVAGVPAAEKRDESGEELMSA